MAFVSASNKFLQKNEENTESVLYDAKLLENIARLVGKTLQFLHSGSIAYRKSAKPEQTRLPCLRIYINFQVMQQPIVSENAFFYWAIAESLLPII